MGAYRYLKKDRLSDLIRLIYGLSLFELSWGNNEYLIETCKGVPLSEVNDWIALAEEHPEFFWVNKDERTVIVYDRFVINPNPTPDQRLPKLTAEQIDTLINRVNILHNAELVQYQKNNFKNVFYKICWIEF